MSNQTRNDWQRAESLADLFRFGTLGLVFVAMFVLEVMPLKALQLALNGNFDSDGNELKATKQHLNDMRAIAFSKLNLGGLRGDIE